MRPYKPNSLLTDIAEFHGTWQFCMWLIKVDSVRMYKKSTMGHYYHTHWHPLSVNQHTYVMDDFGNLVLVYGDNYAASMLITTPVHRCMLWRGSSVVEQRRY